MSHSEEQAEFGFTIDTARGPVSALYGPPLTADAASGLDVLFVCAHGAGGHKDDKGMAALSAELRGRGLGVLRFNFGYKDRGSGRPDPMPVLLETWREVADQARARFQPRRLLLGGRSMGGRAASVLVAEGYACDGLVLVAYPLHPAGQQQKLRVAHLAAIAAPVLCFNGTRDELCEPELMRAAVEPLGSRWTMHWLEAADHSLHVLKRSGRSDAEVLSELGATTQAWLAR